MSLLTSTKLGVMTIRSAPQHIVLAGGGLAAQRCAETLRREGYSGAIRMVCAEPHAPYDRPPLSKQLLAGTCDGPSLALRPADWYVAHQVELLLGVGAAGLRMAEHTLVLADGAELRYDRLLIATGARARRLRALSGRDNVSVLRTVDDGWALCDALSRAERVGVIGAGFIGQEVAATARSRGCAVTMVDAAPQPLAAVLGPHVGAWFAQLHRAKGVEVLTGRTLRAVSGNGAVTGLELSDGRRIAVDHVVVGVGVDPDAQWLGATGLTCSAGVPADDCGRTRAGDVFAAGDVAASFDPAPGAGPPARTGRRRRAKAPVPPGRCWASIPVRRLPRASGATSTASASSIWVAPVLTTPSRSTVTRRRAISPQPSPAGGGRSLSCSSTALEVYRRRELSLRKEPHDTDRDDRRGGLRRPRRLRRHGPGGLRPR